MWQLQLSMHSTRRLRAGQLRLAAGQPVRSPVYFHIIADITALPSNSFRAIRAAIAASELSSCGTGASTCGFGACWRRCWQLCDCQQLQRALILCCRHFEHCTISGHFGAVVAAVEPPVAWCAVASAHLSALSGCYSS